MCVNFPSVCNAAGVDRIESPYHILEFTSTLHRLKIVDLSGRRTTICFLRTDHAAALQALRIAIITDFHQQSHYLLLTD